jgi:hypothetical protein
MNARNLLNAVISALVLGGLILGPPMRKLVYSQSGEDKLRTALSLVNRTTVHEAQQAVLELLGKVTAGTTVDSQYFQQRRTKLIAAIDESERAGLCKAVTGAVSELAQKYDPGIPQQLIDKFRAAGVSQTYIDEILRTPETDITRWASFISQNGCEAFLRTVLDQLGRELATNLPRGQIRLASSTNTRPYSCVLSYLVGLTLWIDGASCDVGCGGSALGGLAGIIRGAQDCGYGPHTWSILAFLTKRSGRSRVSPHPENEST